MRCLAVVVSLLALHVLRAAPTPVPSEALKVLQIARGKPCRSGVVFMDGKYIAPPYVVKRYGTAIMINDVQVTAPLVAWEDFLKTQTGVQVTRNEASAGESTTSSAPAATVVEEDDPLADLFDDDPKPFKKKGGAKKSAKPQKPTVTTSYKLEGDFVQNEASKELLDKINRYRTDVNARLMKGGFVFFGSNYSRVSGEARETKRLLDQLPKIMRTCSNSGQMYSELRRNGFHYLTESIANDLFRNKHLYPQIEARARRLAEDEKFDKLMNGKIW